MPKVASTIHSTVQQAVDETLRESMNPAWAGIDDEGRRAIARYWRMRQRRIWPLFVAGFLALIAFLGMMTAFEAGTNGVGIGAGVAMLTMVAFMAAQWRQLKLTQEELAAVAPALRLTPIQRAYLDARLVLDTLDLPRDTQTELAAQLDQLVDEEARLRAMQERGAVRAVRPDEIEVEREGLRARLAAATDPPSREALEIGLRTCERRLESARHLSLAVQRIDAQLEMIGQSISDVRDGLLRLRLAPGAAGAAIELNPIRQTLSHVQNHAAALEAAVAEVQAIDGRA